MANGSGHVSVAGEAWLARFHAEPLTVDPSKDSCWFRGQHADTGGVLLRRIEGISFSDAIRDLTELLETLDQTQPGIMRCLAIVVSADGKIVAGSAAASSNFTVAADPAAAASLVGDSSVDVWAIYPDTGDEALVECRTDPLAACERLASLAEVLDRLPNGHGAIDFPCLRTGPSGPILLGTRLAPLEASRRGRLDATGPWLTVAPERCLPPGRGTPAGDQYALAVLWTVARGGSPPHEAATAEALVRSKLSDPPSLVGLEEAERSVVARALSSAAEDRFESSVAFVAALRAAIQPNVPAAAGTVPVGESEAGFDPKPTSEPEPVSAQPASLAADTRPGTMDATQPLTHALDEGPQEQVVIPLEPPAQPGSSVAMTGQAVLLATPPYKAGDMILPGYRLERPLGKGGFGEVWKAAAPGGMSVAIKVISRLGRREGSREFRALRTVKDVHHAHIVPIFGVWLKTSDGRLLDEIEAEQAGERILQGQDRGIRGTVAAGSGAGLDSLELVVAMGLGDRSLSDELQARAGAGGQGVEAGQLLGWMRQAALAIDHFNRGSARDGVTAAAVQHCDIKPQNMLLVGNVVQVCDFGLARVQGQVRATANNLLSIAYAAPEMMVKPYDPSPHTDQYSLAVTYYELRTGRLPYGEQPESSADDISAPELMLAKTKGEVRLTRVPPTEQRVLERALALEPAGRFGSCTEFIDMLEAAVDTDLAEVGPARAGRIPWWPIVGLSVGGLASAALLAWVLLGPAETTDPGNTVTSETTVDDPAAIAKQRQEADAADLVRQIDQEIAGAVGEDGGIDRRRLATARSLGERLMTLDGRRGSQKSLAVAAIEEIAEVLADPGPEPRGLDAAVSEFDRANAVLPKAVASRLGAALAAKLVDRADRRLRDHDLQSDGVPVQGKKRAIEDSLLDLEQAIRLDSRSWLAWNSLGLCESLRGGYGTAIAHYTKALELGPSTASERQDVLRRRAFACVEAGRLSEAADDYLASDDRHVIRKLWALYDEKAWPSGNYAAAAHILELLRNTLDESPDDFQAGATPGPDDVIGDLAWLLACGFGDDPPNRAVPMSKRYLERVLEGDPDPDKESNARGTLACSYARAGRFEDAIEELKAARAAGLEPDAFEKRLEAFEAGKPWDLPLE